VAVRPCEFEGGQWLSFGGEVLRIVEPDAKAEESIGVELAGRFSIEGAGRDDGFAVDYVPGCRSKACGNCLLVAGVDIRGVANIQRDGHGGVGDIEGATLCIADCSPILGWRIEARDLDVEEGKIALGEVTSPVTD